MTWRVIADDLSGAAEVAASLARLGPVCESGSSAQSAHSAQKIAISTQPVLTLAHSAQGAHAENWTAGNHLAVVDSDNRVRTADDASERLAALLADVAPGASLFLKYDSLVRGNIGAELSTVRASRPVLFCPAVPSNGRTVLGGVVHAAGIPLHTTSLWAAELAPAASSIIDQLNFTDGSPTAAPRADCVSLSLDDIRSEALTDALGDAARWGQIVICDAETDADLDLIAHAGIELGYTLAGSSGLSDAVARATADGDPIDVVAGTGATSAPVAGIIAANGAAASSGVLFILGTASLALHAQLAALDAIGVPVLRIDADGLASADIPAGTVAVVVDGAVNPARTGEIAASLAALAVRAHGGRDLVLSGGETARSVLDALGIRTLRPLAQAHPGAVVSLAPDGRLVATRPGSYGAPTSLVEILGALTELHPNHKEGTTMTTPFIAVTMGDGAGVGPEVIVAAVLNPSVVAESRPVVIGDAQRLRLAAESIGVDVDVQSIESVGDAVFEGNRINVIDLGLLPADLPWGVLSPVAGDAAFHYVRVASELAMAGDVQAICTAPLNKEALHAGGHIYPGHTELLASLTGTEEVSMMLSSEKLKVIHVTTHIGLIDAVARIEPGLVQRTIERGYEALRRAGVDSPKIGVCAINPHAGENGLFGYNEEAEKIAPGVEAAKAKGIDVTGPLPADTLFFLAGRGDYDLVVAMYHDQGHGPVKVLGIEAGVNITVGLPVIRTSVDHGTAFDIAGKNIADPRSMVEALHQAAEMATAVRVSA
jgi:4-hydroxythreonine-4-phosphate dehydrogenase